MPRTNNIVVIGTAFGDEAKGKHVHELAENAQMVVRYAGGNNAGHTVVHEGSTFKFHLLPSGILYPHCTNVLSDGVVINPIKLVQEIEELQAVGRWHDNLVISPRAHVILPHHPLIDLQREQALSDRKIGTTGMGIGPAYIDKAGRVGVRIGDLVDQRRFEERFSCRYDELTSLFQHNSVIDIGVLKELKEEYRVCGEKLAPFVRDVEPLVQRAAYSNNLLIFEGAQGTFLDIDSGTYPFVTSSHPVAAGACLGTGIGPRDITEVIGVMKAYTSRVGSGPFPTRITDPDLVEYIRSRGKEVGTSTGRVRDVGWADGVMLKRAVRLNSVSELRVGHLDVLAGLETISFCIGYKHLGDSCAVGFFPESLRELEMVEPTYNSFDGWDESITAVRCWHDLPRECKHYLDFIQDFTGTPIKAISVGPEREATIHRP